MFKILAFAKRRKNMSMDDFIAYYETHHRLMIQYLPGVRRYMRRFASPLSMPTGRDELDFDVVIEMWFDDRDAYDEAYLQLRHSELSSLIRADEFRLFELGSIMSVSVQEYESDMRDPRGRLTFVPD